MSRSRSSSNRDMLTGGAAPLNRGILSMAADMNRQHSSGSATTIFLALKKAEVLQNSHPPVQPSATRIVGTGVGGRNSRPLSVVPPMGM